MLRKIVGFFLIFLIIEGALRKWVLPEYATEVFAFKDIILAGAFVAYVFDQQRNPVRVTNITPWYLWVGLIIGYAIISGFSIQTLVGLRYYLASIPLIFLVPALISDSTDLERVAAWTVRLSFPVGILAIAQYLAPIDDPLNTYAWTPDEAGSSFGVEAADLFSGVVRARVTSTFSYISTFAAFLSASWILAWLSLLHGRSRIDRWLAGLALILIAFNMGMNGSRALLLIAVVTGLPFAVALIRHLGTVRTQFAAACFAIAVAYSGVTIFEPFALTAERGGTEEGIERITGVLYTPFATLSDISWFGTGVGSTFGGFEQLGYRGNEGFDEVNLDRVGIELGVAAYAFVLFLKMMMLAKAVGAYRRAPTESLRHWCMAALLVQLSTNWQIPFYNSIAATYYFCAIGLVYWIEWETNRRRERSAEAYMFSAGRAPAVRTRPQGW